jgi:hypothetical protein
MKLGTILPVVAGLVAPLLGYQASAFVRPIPCQEMNRVRGGQQIPCFNPRRISWWASNLDTMFASCLCDI